MKALIVSDNHRDEFRLEELIELYKEEVDVWLHCGDSEFKAQHRLLDYFKTVEGNMDIDPSFPAYRVEAVGHKKVLIVHGDRHNVRFTFDYLEELADNLEVDIVFYGHTHIAKVDQVGNKYFINPGSIAQPRGEVRYGSYAIYENGAGKHTISFYDWNHNYLPELSQDLNEQ